MLRMTKWEKWQRRGLEEIRRKRKERHTDPSRAYLMPFFAASSQLEGEDFQRFAELVGGRQAETFLWRCLGYACQHAPLGGCRGPIPPGSAGTSGDASANASRDASRAPLGGGLLVSRAAFGQLVLSRTHDRVSRRVGETVYDALVSSTICVRVNPATLFDLPPTEEIPVGRSIPSRTRPGRRGAPVPDTSRRDGDEMDHPSSPTSKGEGGSDLPEWCGSCVDGFQQELNGGRGGCCTDCLRGRKRADAFRPGFVGQRREEDQKKRRMDDLKEQGIEDRRSESKEPQRLRDVIPKKFREGEDES